MKTRAVVSGVSRTPLPSVAVELETALQALDAALDLCKIVRFPAARAGGGVVSVDGARGLNLAGCAGDRACDLIGQR